MHTTYNYIIIGAGASGLLLAEAMAADAFFADKRVLIIEKEANKGNDRTWCFWENAATKFNAVIAHEWNEIIVKNQTETLQLPIAPYSYKMLRSSAFYKHVKGILANRPTISFLQAEVTTVVENTSNVTVTTTAGTFTAAKVFNSMFNVAELAQATKPVLQQHFIGWFIKTETPVFNSGVATFMDFSVPQQGNTRFMYVLPTSATEALVEYTLFSKDVLQEAAYETAIKNYLQKAGITNYTITEKEKGCIPMTAHNFYQKNSKHILHIGTAGGFTKASTGYTFKSTQNKIPEIIAALKQPEVTFTKLFKPTRFLWYDAILLQVLAKQNYLGSKVFTTMFKKNKVTTIFKFLDEKTTPAEEFTIINSLPKLPFIKAFFRNLL